MTPQALVDYLTDALGDRVVDAKIAYGQTYVTVAPEAWVDAARLCKEDDQLACRYWEYLDAVDREEDGFEILTHLYSVEHRHSVTLKALVPGGRDNPMMPSLTEVFRGANWSERETYDMFGIDFEGHPRLEPRILTIENFEGWPLRKDFLLTSREAKPWPGSKEPEEQSDTGEGAADAAAEAPASAEEKAAAAKAKAERAKAKAAAMRAQKAEERAAVQRVEAAGGGETEGEASGVVAAAAGDAEPQTPEGAADIAGTAVAKDAAAGAVQGDVAAGAPGDEAGADEPVPEPEAEAAAGEGAPAAPSGTPGIEARGRREGALEQGGPSAGVKELADEQEGAEVSETEDEGRLRESGSPEPQDTTGSGTDADDRTPPGPDDPGRGTP